MQRVLAEGDVGSVGVRIMRLSLESQCLDPCPHCASLPIEGLLWVEVVGRATGLRLVPSSEPPFSLSVHLNTFLRHHSPM
jgi:hypothetical protein